VSSFVLTRENSGLDLGIRRYDQAFSAASRTARIAPCVSPASSRHRSAHGSRRGGERTNPGSCGCNAIDPHGPYTPLPEFRGAFEGGPTKNVPRSLIPAYQWLGTEDFASYVNAYDDEILQTDHSLGPLIAAIEALPSPRGTIVVFTADHGEAFGEHGAWFEHGQSLHTEEIHVPLVVKDSGRPRSGRVAAPVSLLDLAPTLLARLSIEADLPFDGVRLDEREGEGAPPILANWRPGDVMACRAPWKLIARVRSGHERGTGQGLERARDGAARADGERRRRRRGRSPAARRRCLRRARTGFSLYDIDADPPRAGRVASARGRGGRCEAAARALLARDPLDAASGRRLEKKPVGRPLPEAQEKLRSLGYAGP
jgi:hypothetical protein